MRSAPAGNIWFQHWQRKPEAQIRLFCFPYAGGGASIFRTWSENMPAEVEVCPVQLPGRENRLLEAPFGQIAPLIAALAPLLRPYLDLPYAFFGHSMGTLVAFELIRYFRRMGYDSEPFHLFVSAHRAPHLPDPDPPVHALPEPEFIKELRRLQGTPEEVLRNEELFRLILPLLRADFALCETYHYEEEQRLRCPITAYGGLQDEDVPRESIAAWQKHTTGSFKLRFFMGGHFFLQKEQQKLLQALHQDLSHRPG